MLNLLHKDFIALKSSLWMIALYLIVFSCAFIPKMESSIHIVGMYTAFATIILATTIDIKNRNHNFLRKRNSCYQSCIFHPLTSISTAYSHIYEYGK